MTIFKKSHFFRNVFVGPVSLSEIWSIPGDGKSLPFFRDLEKVIFQDLIEFEKNIFQNLKKSKKSVPRKCRGIIPTYFLYYLPLCIVVFFLYVWQYPEPPGRVCHRVNMEFHTLFQTRSSCSVCPIRMFYACIARFELN